MSFEWKKGYEEHACRRVLTHCERKKMDMEDTIKFLSIWEYDCGEKEVQEYLKQYPITKEEFRREEKLVSEIKKILKSNKGNGIISICFNDLKNGKREQAGSWRIEDSSWRIEDSSWIVVR